MKFYCTYEDTYLKPCEMEALDCKECEWAEEEFEFLEELDEEFDEDEKD